VQLHARAGSLGGDAVCIRLELLRPVDLDEQILAASGQDLLVQHPVARVGRQRARARVLLAQRRQDPDHDQAAAGAARLLIGGVEAGPELLLQSHQRVPRQLPGRDVDLQIELPELGPPDRIDDGVKHLRAAHGRRQLSADQIQLDFQAHLRRTVLEHPIAQHPGEHVERAAQLVPVGAPFLAADPYCLNIATHVATCCPGRGSSHRRPADPIGARAFP
jgi:hypothetical protein